MNNPIVKEISCQELHEISRTRKVDVVDVRTAEEFRDRRVVGARNIPLDTLAPEAVMASRTTPSDEPLYFICELGGRSEWACGMMMAAGYPNVVNVVGGTQVWAVRGLPTTQGA